MHIELTFLLNRRFIKVTLFLENLFHFPLDILPNCFFKYVYSIHHFFVYFNEKRNFFHKYSTMNKVFIYLVLCNLTIDNFYKMRFFSLPPLSLHFYA